MGYGILFVVGLLTSLHCIAMCGGINLSQCVSYKYSSGTKTGNLKPSFLYNAGRVVSYTVIGGIVGGIGSVVSFSGATKGIVAIIAGLFMVIMGLNMLNIFPWLKRFNPRMPKLFGNKIYNNNGKNGPFYIGLLNGLMPCGPLQAMQLYALGTGSVAAGALSMLIFSMGTVPLMFGFGAVSSLLGKKFTGKLMKVSAVLVMVLGFIMMGRGFLLSGINPTFADSTSVKSNSNVAVAENGVQVVSIDLKPNGYAPIVVQKGIPVKFIINAAAENINGCNNAIIIPKYNIQKALEPGENIIEFTPEETGTIPYSCWMGMIGSSIKVVDDLGAVTPDDLKAAEAGTVTGGGCGGGSCCGN
jgi:sulfite exporter TauE/SafE